MEEDIKKLKEDKVILEKEVKKEVKRHQETKGLLKDTQVDVLELKQTMEEQSETNKISLNKEKKDLKVAKEELEKLKDNSRAEIERLKKELDKKGEEVQKILKDVMREKKAKGDFNNEAKQAKLDLAEKISECNKTELQLKKKDEEVDIKRKALQDLQNEYQGMMSRNLDMNQSCKNKDIKIKE